jgi:hypothetical protein
MDPAQARRLETIRRLQAELIAQMPAFEAHRQDTPSPAPAPPSHQKRYHNGRFGARHGLTP